MIEMKIVLNQLAKRFPKKYAKMNHDHVGLMTGKMPGKINKILLLLDLDWEILPKVKEIKPDVIITHHPFIFGTKYQVFKWDESKKLLCEQIDKMGIPVYSYHTNFDTGRGGINDSLAEALGLEDVYIPEKNIMMRIGYLKEAMPIEEFANFAKKQFDVEYSLLIDAGNKTIKKVGIIGGAGSRSYSLAMNEGCDIYISGDAPHYIRRDIVNNHFNYLDMPHEIEKIFMKAMKKYLLEMDPTLNVVTIDHEQLPKVI